MSIAEKTVRQSVSLPARVARRVKSMAKIGSTSTNRVIVDLIEIGIEARDQEKKRFFELAVRPITSGLREITGLPMPSDYSQPCGGCNFDDRA